MAGIGKRRFKRALEETLGKKQEKLKLVPALLGAYFNGQRTITVAGREDFVWCRVRGSTSEVVQAFNETVAHHYDLPILIYRDPNAPDIYKVYGRDIRQYDDWGGLSFANPPHGRSHSFGGQEGNDPVWIYKRQYLPMLPRPIATGTLGIWIEPEFYYFGGQYHWWPGSGTSSLEGYKPTGANNGRYVTVYIDGNSGIPQYLLGDEFSSIHIPADPGDYIALPNSAQGVPIAAVFMLTGTERIGWGEIYDLRQPEIPVPTTGSALQVYDDHISRGQFGGIDFLWALAVVGTTGTTAYVDVAPPVTGSFVVYDEGVLLGSALGLNVEGDQAEIILSGTTAHLAFTEVVFGSCYGNEIGWTQAAAVQNTWYEISDADMADGQLFGVTHDGSGQLTVTEPGIYFCIWTMAGETDAGAGSHIQCTFSVNGTETNDGMNHTETRGANAQIAMAGNAILVLADNATIEVSMRTTDAGTPDISVDHLNISIVKIGDV